MSTLWLIGMMGAGKTTVGRRVADELGLEFVDVDDAIQEHAGMSIARYWEARGEDAFRDLEQTEIARLAGRPAVVATGGGAILRDENLAAMGGSGTIVWLRAGADTLAGRLAETGDRPLLAGGPAEPRLEELLDTRWDRYQKLADTVIDTDDLPVDEVVERVKAAWNGS